MKTLRTLAVFLTLVSGASQAFAADLGVAPPVPMARPADASTAHHYAQRETVLLLIRETFTLIDAAGVMQQLAAAVDQRGSGGPTEADQIDLDRALLAEGSYYLVSLRYLVLAGGAAWPEDRPARFHDDDALVRLDALQEQLFEAVAQRTDPLPIFIEAQKIWALTEGYAEVPEDRDVFGHRDAIVEDVLSEDVDQART